MTQNHIQHLDFRPFPGILSPHLQMIVSRFSSAGQEPYSETLFIRLEGRDQLACKMTVPAVENKNNLTTLVLVHGLGGSDESSYMVRLARKFSQQGYRIFRVNLRNCGSGFGLSSLPYNAGTSSDLLAVLKHIKELFPKTKIVLAGFSLGGNMSLKLAGELHEQAENYIDHLIGICPPLNLYDSIQKIMQPSNWLYHRFYLKHFLRQCGTWLEHLEIKSLYEFDEKVTAPFWGYSSAIDYYNKCSSLQFLDRITVPCRLLFAHDDPIIDYRFIKSASKKDTVEVWVTQKGGHMGFIGWPDKENGLYWMDYIVQKWVNEKAEG